jgi:hypothetical protein
MITPNTKDRPYFIAVDFDGCLCKSQFPELGPPNYGTLAKLRLKKFCVEEIWGRECRFILWTCREDLDERAYLTEAKNWCMENNIPIDYYNENPILNFDRPDKVRKVFADEYWDDKAVLMD